VATVRTKTFSFGACSFNRTSPKREQITPKTKIVNVLITFEEALKLSLAIDECVRKLTTYNRSTKLGKSMGLNLAVHLDKARVTVNEEKV
jgi:hypothetical protein